MTKKITIILIIIAIMLFTITGLIACSNNAMQKFDEVTTELADYFDLTDTKELWNGSFVVEINGNITNIQFENLIPNYFDVAIFVVFRRLRHGMAIPNIGLKQFGLENVRGLSSITLRPEHLSDDVMFRHSMHIYLTENTQKTFAKAIEHLQRLDFIKSARPANIVYLFAD